MSKRSIAFLFCAQFKRQKSLNEKLNLCKQTNKPSKQIEKKINLNSNHSLLLKFMQNYGNNILFLKKNVDWTNDAVSGKGQSILWKFFISHQLVGCNIENELNASEANIQFMQ